MRIEVSSSCSPIPFFILTLPHHLITVKLPILGKTIVDFDRLAHLDRALASGAKGGGFESRVCRL